jgi:hypothetical protein
VTTGECSTTLTPAAYFRLVFAGKHDHQFA